MQHVYDAAHEYVGLKEYPGAEHNPQVIEDFATVGHGWVQDDETPWCAAFVGARLAECGIAGTNKLNARSYETWGEGVAFNDVRKGDVCVFWRKDKNGPYGHVAFFDSYDADRNVINVLGGNQGNAVSVASYPYHRLIALRRAVAPVEAKPPKPKPMSKSTTLPAATVSGVAGAGATILAATSKMDPTVQYIIAGGGVAIVLMSMWIFKERLKKLARGI